MKRAMTSRTGIYLLGTMLTAGALIIAACADDDPASIAPPPGTSEDGSTPTTEGDGGQVPDDPDASFEDDGGGELVDDDGGVTLEEDGGFDGGVECETLTPGAIVETTCGNRITLYSGGELVSETYDLASIQVLRDKLGCADAGAYEAAEHRGTLKVTASSPVTATFEFFDQGREKAIAERPRPFQVRRYDVAATAVANTLTLAAEDCKVTTPPKTASYSALAPTKDRKRTLILRLPYTKPGSRASSFALYRYVAR